MENKIFDKLKDIYNKAGFRLYMVGGTSRDFLLELDIKDFDFASDATPEEAVKFLPNVKSTFAKYGVVNLYIDDYKIDITTFRVESNYEDKRRPSKITFVKDPMLDYIRRDFSINSIYIDEQYNIIDFCNGVEDLKNKILKFIGDPYERIKEDPLRILRAVRFKNKYNLTFEEQTREAIVNNINLINCISSGKLNEEINKFNRD